MVSSYTTEREIDPTAKALLLTANHEQFTEGKQIEGQDYLRVITKPISNEKLLAEIDSVLNRPTSLVSLENHVQVKVPLQSKSPLKQLM